MHQSPVHVTPAEPHGARARKILEAHPEVRDLFGIDPVTALWCFLFFCLQIGIAISLASAPTWVVLVALYTIGPWAANALGTLNHEAGHNLVFTSARANRFVQLFISLPLLVPLHFFRRAHLRHHLHLNDVARDLDQPKPLELRFVGRSPFRKALWLIFQSFFLVARAPFLGWRILLDRWLIASLWAQILGMGALLALFGVKPIVYLVGSSLAFVGLHPLGARAIQEHQDFGYGQETFSYYGPMNRILFNAGYHLEHHDFPRIPWSRLPRVRKLAPEFYDSQVSYHSWTRLLLDFLGSRDKTLFQRAARSSR